MTFAYVRPLSPRYDRLLFVASRRTDTSIDGSNVNSPDTNSSPDCVVKFSQRYGTEAHQSCAEAGSAPKILLVDNLAGGWTVVVMEFIGGGFRLFSDLDNAARAKLGPQLRSAVRTMHDNGYVHGDLKRANIFGDPQTDAIQIVDWD